MVKGTVTLFNGEKSFGFIKPDDGSDDILFHSGGVNEFEGVILI